MSKPTIGRTVHFVLATGNNPGAHRPAIITNVVGDRLVALFVMPDAARDGIGQTLNTMVTPQDEETKGKGTWHWPEREDGGAA